MLGGRFLDVAIPVVPGVGTGVLGVVMIDTEPRQVLVQNPIVLDQFVIDAAIEGDDRRRHSRCLETVGLYRDTDILDPIGIEEISAIAALRLSAGIVTISSTWSTERTRMYG